jgi:hypothetical protein
MVKIMGERRQRKAKLRYPVWKKSAWKRRDLQLRETCRKEEVKEERLLGTES